MAIDLPKDIAPKDITEELRKQKLQGEHLILAELREGLCFPGFPLGAKKQGNHGGIAPTASVNPLKGNHGGIVPTGFINRQIWRWSQR
ncbi:MAG: hypothetical protein ACO34J_01845 [Prochlorothrix sp.]